LTTLDRATYLGGTSADLIEAIAIHPTTGDVYVAGYTFSSNMPGTAGGAQPSNNGFVRRVRRAA
jgi:secreted PhoX family phosphatase